MPFNISTIAMSRLSGLIFPPRGIKAQFVKLLYTSDVIKLMVQLSLTDIGHHHPAINYPHFTEESASYVKRHSDADRASPESRALTPYCFLRNGHLDQRYR